MGGPVGLKDMTMPHDPESSDDARGLAAGAISAATKQAQRAIDSARGAVGGTDLDDLSAKASAAASSLYQGGRDLLANNEDLSKAAEHLSAAVRKNPLAAVGVAFSAGLLLALLVRG
jgi:ElaB/YqjD/DUF883 family membrane-anchored ribosome-binding protein